MGGLDVNYLTVSTVQNIGYVYVYTSCITIMWKHPIYHIRRLGDWPDPVAKFFVYSVNRWYDQRDENLRL